MLLLSDCGLVHEVHWVTTPSLPLKAYEDLKAFKLFMVDVGLQQDVLLDVDEMFMELRGALTGLYVLQQLKTIKELIVYYWAANWSIAEANFVIDNGSDVIPFEVKSEVNLQVKSLKVYHEKFQPQLSVQTSIADYKKENGYYICCCGQCNFLLIKVCSRFNIYRDALRRITDVR